MPNVICRNIQGGGTCKFGSRCRFLHPIDDVPKGVAYSFGSCVKQNRAWEDRHTTYELSPALRLFMVCDGHCNPRGAFSEYQDKELVVVDCVIKYLPPLLVEMLQKTNMDDEALIARTITATFLAFDTTMKEKGREFGATCNLVIVDQLRHKLYHANLGDSRMIVLHKNKIVFESKDHNVQDADETKRVLAAGGSVFRDTHVLMPPDLNNALGISRAFGDFKHKMNQGVFDPVLGAICAVPTITILQYKPSTTLLLMTDAVFNCPNKMTSQNVVDTFLSIENRKMLTEDVVAQKLCMLCLEKSQTTDDMTFMIVNLF